jgi:hypothetical protein
MELEPKVLKASKVCLVRLEQQVPLGPQAPLVLQVPLERQGLLVQLDHKARQEWLVEMVQLVPLVQSARLEQQAWGE